MSEPRANGSQRLLVTAIVLGFVVLGAVYSFVNPVFEAPDEEWHFAFVKHLVDRRELPVQPPERYGHAVAQEASQTPLYYFAGALATFWIDTGDYTSLLQANPYWAYDTMNRRNDNKSRYTHPAGQALSFSGTVLAVRLLRFLSLLLGVATVLCTYAIAREALPKHTDLAPAAATLVAFTPQFLFVTSAVTNDSAVIALTSVYLLLLLRALRRGLSHRGAALLGLVLGLALLAKLSALMLVPLTVVALLARYLLERRHELGSTGETKRASLSAARHIAVCLGVAALVAGWWYLRNWWLYGEPLGSEMMLKVFGRRQPSPGLLDLLPEFPLVQQSFWAAFGWGNVLVDERIYLALNLFVAASAFGLLLGAARKVAEFRVDRRRAVGDFSTRLTLVSTGLLALWCLLVSASLLRWMQSTTAPIGRLLFPTLAATSIFLLLGIGQLTPARLRKAAYGLTVVLFIALSLAAPFRYIAPAYARPPAFDPRSQAAPSHPLSLSFGNIIDLVGYDLSVESPRSLATARDGEAGLVTTTPGTVLKLTLYWLPSKEIPQSYAVFVHLLDPAWQSLGQRDTLPGLGNYPTSYWKPGEGIQDTYYVPVAGDVDPPVLASLRVGLYELDSRERLAAESRGRPVDSGPELAKVKIVPAGGEISPSKRLDVRFANGMALEGYGLTDEADPGQSGARSGPGTSRLVITLVWRAWQHPSKDFTVFSQLLGPEGSVVAQHDSMPRNGAYPTSAWDAGEQIVDRHAIALPANLAAGSYQLRVGIYDPVTGERVDGVGGGLADRSISLDLPPSLTKKP